MSSTASREIDPGPLARTPEEWATLVQTMGGRAFHGKQVFRWIHARGVLDPAAMSDLPSALRERLVAEGVGAPMEIASERRALDSTRKLLVRMKDGATVETVLIPGVSGGPNGLRSPVAARGIGIGNVGEDTEAVAELARANGESDDASMDADAAAAVDDDDDEEDPGTRHGRSAPAEAVTRVTRVTQCISTQVGCAMGCIFCASGVAGLKRQMTASEIIAQILVGRARLDPHEQLRNVVLMGMGEPLHNYPQTVRALRLLTHRDGVNLSSRRVTVSTSGLVPEIEKLGKDFNGDIGLAISLHAADDETRSRLMPINRKYPLAKLMDALRAYPLPRRRRITIEYTLVAGQNDTEAEAKKVARLLRGLPVKINLIPMNPIATSDLGPTDFSGVLRFQQTLCDAGYSCFIRRRRGDEVGAACGQLALHGAPAKVRGHRGLTVVKAEPS
jgi:23S rRNA (adenine2503-C2)-methyltransferase